MRLTSEAAGLGAQAQTQTQADLTILESVMGGPTENSSGRDMI